MAPRILVLGPIGVARPDTDEELGGRLAHRLLAALVVSVNHAVDVDRLVEVVWEGRPPKRATNALQSHVSALRHALGEHTVVYRDHSYTLLAKCDDIDACLFERFGLMAERSIGDDPRKARSACRQGLALWRGRAFGELADDEYFSLEALRLEELRHAVVEVLLRAELDLGLVDEAVAKLQAATIESPYRENLWRLLITGLAIQHRRVEAIRAYDDYVATLAAVGLLPSELLRNLADQIAAGELNAR